MAKLLILPKVSVPCRPNVYARILNRFGRNMLISLLNRCALFRFRVHARFTIIIRVSMLNFWWILISRRCRLVAKPVRRLTWVTVIRVVVNFRRLRVSILIALATRTLRMRVNWRRNRCVIIRGVLWIVLLMVFLLRLVTETLILVYRLMRRRLLTIMVGRRLKLSRIWWRC